MESAFAVFVTCFLFVTLVLTPTSAAGGASKQARSKHSVADIEDNEFAEFEDFEEEIVDDQDGTPLHTKPPENVRVERYDDEVEVDEEDRFLEGDDEDDDEATVEEEKGDDEFDHFEDDEEFEGFQRESAAGGQASKKKPGEKPDLKIAQVPLHLRNWDSFTLELLMVAGLGVYFLNYIAGKTKNHKIAANWFSVHKEMLTDNFSLVGDDGQNPEPSADVLMKDTDSQYSVWCSGRTCCDGLLATIRLVKRQDLINTIARLMRPQNDQLNIKVNMTADEMDTFVLAVAHKKSIGKMHKEANDLSLFCSEKKSGERSGLPANFQILSEIGEATSAILDGKVVSAMQKYEALIDYIHISDQYSGVKAPEESQPTKQRVFEKVLIFNFNVPNEVSASVEGMERMKPMLQLVFHLMERVKRLRLSKEAKMKAEKNRLKVSESFLKQTHAARQEAAQQRREDKRRAEKEKMLQDDDPDKQRKWEEREHRRELKKRNPIKMKQIRAM